MRFNIFKTLSAPNFSRAVVILTVLTVASRTQAGGLACQINSLVEQVMADDAVTAEKAVTDLRQLGQPALDALCTAHAAATEVQVGATGAETGEKLQRLRKSIDAVAKQRDAFKSRLFWHTDLQSAISEADRTHRPILSLRLLGNLDDDLSCANSRYFRTVLYSNAAVSNYLRDHFVMHWQTVRPVPVITIDFGDGRRIERTITGNSIHYVLDSNGEIVDAIPGLYGPRAFLLAVQSAEGFGQALANLSRPEDKYTYFREHHTKATHAIDAAWRDDLNRATLGVGASTAASATESKSDAASTNPNPEFHALRAVLVAESKMKAEAPMLGAVLAAPIARTKMGVERPMLGAALAIPLTVLSPESQMNDELWTRIASFHAEDAQLDQASIELMRLKTPPAPPVPAEVAAKVAITKRRADDPFMRVLRNFQQSIALDTVRNEYLLHRQIHHWLAESAGIAVNKDQFNERVYAELFLTPLNDPWMGLAANDSYAALDQGGLLSACK